MRNCIVIILLFAAQLAYSQADTLKASQAKHFVGKEIIVKDQVAGARFFDRADKKTFLINLAEKYPNTPLTVVLYDQNYLAFEPKDGLEGKTIVVKGVVSLFNEKVQIIVTDIKNITVLK